MEWTAVGLQCRVGESALCNAPSTDAAPDRPRIPADRSQSRREREPEKRRFRNETIASVPEGIHRKTTLP
jgi:hypothetical protein